MGATVIRSTRGSQAVLTGAVVFCAVAASLPWWGERAHMHLATEFLYVLALAQMWNLLAGYAGLVSVGQQAFIGAAGYALFVLAQTLGVNPFLAIFLSLLVPAALAVPSSPVPWRCCWRSSARGGSPQ